MSLRKEIEKTKAYEKKCAEKQKKAAEASKIFAQKQEEIFNEMVINNPTIDRHYAMVEATRIAKESLPGVFKIYQGIESDDQQGSYLKISGGD